MRWDQGRDELTSLSSCPCLIRRDRKEAEAKEKEAVGLLRSGRDKDEEEDDDAKDLD